MIAVNPILRQCPDSIAYQNQQQLFESSVVEKLGILPNAFKTNAGSFEVKQKMWEMTEFSYINNALPSLFKERMFVYLSTFCKTRYCLVRHIGFLTGLGHPAGDHSCAPQSIEDVIELLQFKLPLGNQLDPYIHFCLAHETCAAQLIESGTYAEKAVFACAAHVFMQSDKATESSAALSKILGNTQFELLIVLLNFIHATHLSASVNAELVFEEDVTVMLQSYKQIADLVLQAPDVFSSVLTQQMLDELALLHKTVQKYQALSYDYESLVKQYSLLHKKQMKQQANLHKMQELQQHAQLLELIHDPIIVWGLDGHIALWNRGAEKHYGFTKDEAIGQVVHQLLQTKATLLPADVLASIVANKEWAGEIHHTTKNGKTILVDSHQQLFESGGQQWILETNHDITARKQAKAALRKSEERLQLAANVTGFGLHDMELNSNEVYWSAEMKALHGYAADAVITTEMAVNSIHPDDRQEALKTISRAMKPDSDGKLEHAFRIQSAGNKETRWVVNHSRVIFSEESGQRKPIRCSGIIVDVTKSRMDQEQLRLSEEKYRTLFESMDEGFCIIEVLFDENRKPVDYRFLDCNPAFERQTGLTNAPGKRMRQLVPDHEQLWFDTYGHVASTGQPIRFESKAESLNRYFDVNAFSVGNKSDNRVAVLFKDITHQKKMEQQREEFMGIASHELKTPVTSIKVYAELLQDILAETGDTQNAVLMQKMNAQVDRLTELIRALLDTTRIAEGHLLLNREKFDLHTLIADKTEELQRLSKRHRILWNANTINCITADKDKIGQVMTNLLSNAIKYSPNGGDIHINCNRQADRVVVSVQDCGLGIPKELQSKIFDRLYRVRHSRTHTISGLGLGLYITAGIVQQHGGNINVQSIPGKGSTFSFALPC